MAKLNLTPPFVTKGVYGYAKFKEWIEENFYSCNCAYCFGVRTRVTLDHYIPVAFDKTKKNDPHNLTSACDVCQGSARKSDYHHQHTTHRRHATIPASHAVHDARNEDVAQIFDLDLKYGCLKSKNNNLARANFLLVLFGLDLTYTQDPRNDDRVQILSIMDDIELALQNRNAPQLQGYFANTFPRHMRMLARNELWLYCLDVPLPPLVKQELHNGTYTRAKAI